MLKKTVSFVETTKFFGMSVLNNFEMILNSLFILPIKIDTKKGPEGQFLDQILY